MNMEFIYFPHNQAGVSLLTEKVRYLDHEGFGLPAREPQGTRLPLQDGVHHLDEETYMPPRYMHLGLHVHGDTVEDWKNEDDALLAKVIGFQETKEMGILYIVKANGEVRTIQCMLLEYPNDSELTFSSTQDSRRVLTFYAPQPYFRSGTETTTSVAQAIEGAFSGYVWPVVFPWASWPTMNYLNATVQNNGNARTWPTIYLSGPATNPLFYNRTTHDWAQIPVTIAAGDEIGLFMEDGHYTVQRVGLRTETARKFVLGSTLWSLQVGDNKVLLAAADLAQGEHAIYHFDRYKAL